MRSRLDRILALGGVLIIFAQALATAPGPAHVALIFFGFLASQVGTWGLARLVMPERREYIALRAEVDEFLYHVRTLNRQVVDGDGTGAAYTRRDLLIAVDRICDAAGVVGESLPGQADGDSEAGAGPPDEPAEMPASG